MDKKINCIIDCDPGVDDSVAIALSLYDEVLDIYREHLSKEEMLNLDNKLFKASKKLKKANISECIEYFDKKRDLQIGGAPTDIVTQLFGMGVCGAAVAKAEKKDRLSKLLTTGIPVVVGLGSSLVFSALLYSGRVGIIAGTVVGGITTLACHLINKYVFKNKDDDDEEEKPQKQHASNIKNKPQEVKNV